MTHAPAFAHWLAAGAFGVLVVGCGGASTEQADASGDVGVQSAPSAVPPAARATSGSSTDGGSGGRQVPRGGMPSGGMPGGVPGHPP
jgi:hypothetical protein